MDLYCFGKELFIQILLKKPEENEVWLYVISPSYSVIEERSHGFREPYIRDRSRTVGLPLMFSYLQTIVVQR